MQKFFSSRSLVEESRVKIVVVGDKNVGKTCFLMSYCSNTVKTTEQNDSIFNNFNALLKIKDKVVMLDFWELPASDDYEKMRQINYPQTDAFFILYSIDNPISLQNALNMWLTEIKINNCDKNPVVFVGNKSDLRDEISTHDQPVSNIVPLLSTKEAKDRISEKFMDSILIFECSARMQIGLNEIFLETIGAIFEKREKNIHSDRDKCCRII